MIFFYVRAFPPHTPPLTNLNWGPAVPKPQQRGFTPLNPQDMACILFGVLGAFDP